MSDDLYARFTETARKALELSLREALSLGHNYVATEHLLLALVRQEGTQARVALDALGATPDAVRNQLVQQSISKPKPKKKPSPSLAELLRIAADALDNVT